MKKTYDARWLADQIARGIAEMAHHASKPPDGNSIYHQTECVRAMHGMIADWKEISGIAKTSRDYTQDIQRWRLEKPILARRF
jgi:hypothetical protein